MEGLGHCKPDAEERSDGNQKEYETAPTYQVTQRRDEEETACIASLQERRDMCGFFVSARRRDSISTEATAVTMSGRHSRNAERIRILDEQRLAVV